MAWYDWKGLGVMVLFLNIGFLHTAGMDHAMHIIDMDMIWKEGSHVVYTLWSLSSSLGCVLRTRRTVDLARVWIGLLPSHSAVVAGDVWFGVVAVE
jgi:hypothetical protein